MPLSIAVLKETEEFETRVAATPETVKKFIALGAKVSIEKGAGEKAHMPDDEYKQAGAAISASAATTVKSADIVLCVQTPKDTVLKGMKKNAMLVGMLSPYNKADALQNYAAQNIEAMAMELMPRITRAQSMDVLSSQSNLAGYKAVLDAAEHFPSAFPMMMTAAGTVPPAKVFVMGAGVAGLQAIATAKRLGAVVSATDVRLAAKEQVESLGGKFVMVEDDEAKEAETSGGYAKEMSAAYKKKQAALVEETIQKQDIVITTALIPGKPAPVLVTEAMVKSMKPGAVIVDLAAVQGGNCALTESGKVVEKHGVAIIGHQNFPSRLPKDASALYARNLLNFLGLVLDKEKGTLNINWSDDIIQAVGLTKDGKIVHPNFKGPSKPAATAKKPAPRKTTAKKTTTKRTTTSQSTKAATAK